MKNILTKKNIIILAIILLICLLIFFTCFKTGGAVLRTIDFSRVESVEVVKFADDGDNGMYTIEKSVTLSDEDTEKLEDLIKSSIYRISRSSSYFLDDMDNRYYVQGYNEEGFRILLISCVDNRFNITVFNEDMSEIIFYETLKSSNNNWSKDMGEIFKSSIDK
ncbi:MAG: hypothetical protein R3Y65_05615 [Bacillota bacterium]